MSEKSSSWKTAFGTHSYRHQQQRRGANAARGAHHDDPYLLSMDEMEAGQIGAGVSSMEQGGTTTTTINAGASQVSIPNHEGWNGSKALVSKSVHVESHPRGVLLEQLEAVGKTPPPAAVVRK